MLGPWREDSAARQRRGLVVSSYDFGIAPPRSREGNEGQRRIVTTARLIAKLPKKATVEESQQAERGRLPGLISLS